MLLLAVALATAALAGKAPAGPAAAARPAGHARPAPIPITSLRSDSTARFKVYAPDANALRLAYRDASAAIETFHRCVGQYPPPITVAALGTLADPARVDHAGLRAAGVTVIADDWPSSPERAAADAARSRDRNASPFRGPMPLAERIGRACLRQFEREHATVAVPPGRAHLVPDWFEAAIGGLVLGPAEQNARMAFLRDRLDRRIPLARFFTMERPAIATAPAPAATGRARRGAGATRPVETAEIFDAQSLALARFIAARETARFLGDVLEGYLRGDPETVSLNEAKNLFPRPDALEKDWVAWMKTQDFPHD